MKHPTLASDGLKFYLLVWGIIALVHVAVLYFYMDFSLLDATLDSFIYNALFAAFANGFWYVVAFAGKNKDWTALVALHLGAAVISLFLWTSLSALISQLLIRHSAYQSFSDKTYLWRWIIGFMYYSITVLIFYLIQYYRDIQEQSNREQQLQTLLKDSELRMLKFQINPHFIFNSLNSISALTISQPEQAQEMVIKLSNFLRYSLGKDQEEMITLKQEIENVSLYLDIEKVRFGDRLQFLKDLPDDFQQTRVPNLVLQPLIENAIKYGVYGSVNRVNIRLSCYREGHFIKIRLINDFDKDSVSTKGEGIGLQNVKKRLQLVYGRSDLIEVNKDNDKFLVQIMVPIKSDFE